MKTIIDGLAVEYQDEGQGPAIVLLHGWMHSLASFDAITKLLSQRYRVVRVDLPGFGLSEPPPKPWYVGNYSELVAHLLKKLQLDPVALVGHSFGGRVIMKGLGDGTLKTQKIVLIDTAGNARRNTPRLRFYKAIAKTGKAFATLAPRSLYAAMRRRLYRRAGSDYLEAGALSQTFLNTISEDLTESARKINIPAFLIWGEHDTTTPLEDGKRLASEISGSRFEVLPGAGHAPHLEQPEKVAQLISEFV